MINLLIQQFWHSCYFLLKQGSLEGASYHFLFAVKTNIIFGIFMSIMGKLSQKSVPLSDLQCTLRHCGSRAPFVLKYQVPAVTTFNKICASWENVYHLSVVTTFIDSQNYTMPYVLAYKSSKLPSTI